MITNQKPSRSWYTLLVKFPLKKEWAWTGIFKPVELHSPWAACSINTFCKLVIIVYGDWWVKLKLQIYPLRINYKNVTRNLETNEQCKFQRKMHWPSRTAPRISKMQARINAWRSVSTLAPTEVPNEFATSFAPIPKARINAIMNPTTIIHIWSCWKLMSSNISRRLARHLSLNSTYTMQSAILSRY